MFNTKQILAAGVGIASMAGIMAMTTAPAVAAEGTIEVVTHAGAKNNRLDNAFKNQQLRLS